MKTSLSEENRKAKEELERKGAELARVLQAIEQYKRREKAASQT